MTHGVPSLLLVVATVRRWPSVEPGQEHYWSADKIGQLRGAQLFSQRKIRLSSSEEEEG